MQSLERSRVVRRVLVGCLMVMSWMPIVAQAAVAVREGDTADSLSERILIAEHGLYPHALALVASGRAWLEGGQVRVAEGRAAQEPLFSPQP